MTELLPTRSTYRTDEPVVIELRGHDGPARLRVRRLGDVVAEVECVSSSVELPSLAAGGYGVELVTEDAVVRTAVEVSDDPRGRLRYGFVVDFRPGRDVAAVQDALRRLHLSGVQFYDWAYRHADLLGGGEQYADALGQPVSLSTVRRLIAACHAVGADALGYAAVYGVGRAEWPTWEHLALLTPQGEPYGLGDFLSLVDPAAPDWLEHFTADLARAVADLGFDGFHLDQYGYPKRARRPDGSPVDVAGSFNAMLSAVRKKLPGTRSVFNNVNDFPTWVSASAETDAVYVEVWPPHVTLGDLAAVATRARAAGSGKPVVVAAYQHVYDSAPAEASDLATSFTMATLFSHGATQLLCGEADRILVDPYYVRNHVAEQSTLQLLARWYDFLVEHDELLNAGDDVTGSYVGGYNDDLDVTYQDTGVEHVAVAGTVWRRVVTCGDRLVVHLINLDGQLDTRWDEARRPPRDIGPGALRVRRSGPGIPRVRVADPDRSPCLVDIEVRLDGDHAVAVLPSPNVWQVVVVEDAES